jgi:hypothetical protein
LTTKKFQPLFNICRFKMAINIWIFDHQIFWLILMIYCKNFKYMNFLLFFTCNARIHFIVNLPTIKVLVLSELSQSTQTYLDNKAKKNRIKKNLIFSWADYIPLMYLKIKKNYYFSKCLYLWVILEIVEVILGMT